MPKKNITAEQAFTNLISKDDNDVVRIGTEYAERQLLFTSDAIREEVIGENFEHGGFSQFDYQLAMERRQGAIDVEQMNEVIFSDVLQDFDGNLMLTKQSRNGRRRNFLLVLYDAHFQLKLYGRKKDEENPIVQVEFNIQSKNQKFYCFKNSIKGKKMLDTLRNCGLRFNLELSIEVCRDAINTFFQNSLQNTKLEVVPLYRGWYENDGKLSHFEEESSWEWMTKRAIF